ncbi:EF-hand domain-containing protein [Sulfurospirillum oryzae]|uniref:EF-hand domain-containing protein n=1 Tax=Sulfurospirillum oryzae TaxID=2976535 RepID=UPI0021E872D8|nr:EF-hand domain-containing protein [Sulfurospirillum oryzae]
MNITSNSLYGTSMGATYGSSTSSTSSLSSQFAEALLTSLDSDSSGAVDSTEFSSAALELAKGDTSTVSNAFNSLDSNKDGSISVDELTSMLSAQSTMASGSMPPPPPPSSSSNGKEDNGKTQDELTAMASEVSSTDSNLASLLSSVAQNFSAADANGDGKVTSAEAMAYQQSTQDSTSGTDANNVAASGSMPPPPPPPSSSSSTQEDTGYTKDELTAMASSTSSTDSKLASLFDTLAQNFDAADTNGDGKVTSTEAKAYQDSTKAESMGVASNATTGTDENTLMKALLAQIISNYATQNTLSSSSVSFSA